MTSVKKYKLLDANGEIYENEEKGQLGGHKKLKIYGKLDCKSAASVCSLKMRKQQR